MGHLTLFWMGQRTILQHDCAARGDLNAESLQAKVVEISLMGAADAKVNATESLSVSIKGAGDVRYSGNPKTIKKSVAGAGSVRPKK